MDKLTIARALHVLGVILWIGGVAMVTTVLLPAVRRMKSAEERVHFFEAVEQRFAWQARLTTLLTGLSGLYMLYFLGGLSRFEVPGQWWLYAMVGLWALFTIILFVAEPLFLHDLFLKRAKANPEKTFTIIQVMHWVLLSLSIITVIGAVLGSHGGFAG